MVVLKIFCFVLNICLFIYMAYFAILGVIPFLKKEKKKVKVNKKQHRFAILIAARNEEGVIGNLLDSLWLQNYNKEDYKVYVLPNNCSDKTEEVSIKHGANIIKCPYKTKTKGEVLDYVYNYLDKDDSFDTYIIFDADNIVHPNFLKEINNKLNEGYLVVQGFRDTKNPGDNWISSGYALFYYIQNLFLYKTRNILDASANVNGTGYAINKKVLKEINYKPKTITEDIELTAVCAVNNIKIGYQESAIFYDEQVTDFKASWKQRKRWTQGNTEIFKLYHKDLVKSFKKYHNIHSIDMLLILAAVFLQVLGMVDTLVTFLANFRFNLISYIVTGGIGIISYIFQIIVLSFLVKYYKKDFKDFIIGILLFPLFLFTWLPISLAAIISKNNNWEEIKHNKNVKIQDIVKEN